MVSNDEAILGHHRNGLASNLLGAATVAIMSLAAFGMVASIVLG